MTPGQINRLIVPEPPDKPLPRNHTLKSLDGSKRRVRRKRDVNSRIMDLGRGFDGVS